jgi:hypothetical protein
LIEPTGLHRGREVFLGRCDERGHEVIDVDALLLGDLGEGRSAPQLLVQFFPGKPELLRSSVEAAQNDAVVTWPAETFWPPRGQLLVEGFGDLVGLLLGDGAVLYQPGQRIRDDLGAASGRAARRRNRSGSHRRRSHYGSDQAGQTHSACSSDHLVLCSHVLIPPFPEVRS